MSEYIKNINDSNDIFKFADELSVDELEKIILYTSEKYYNDESVISDSIWDILVDFLKLKKPKSKVLKEIGSPVMSKDKVKLPYNLGSMDKIKPPSSKLNQWKKNYEKDYILSDKLDGVSALIVYTNKKEIKMFTRGTATHGRDISLILKYLPNIPTYEEVEIYCDKNKIKGEKNLIAFRGELIISKNKFSSNWSDIMKNARNTVSGLVNSKNINPKLAGDTKLVIYEVVDPINKILKQFNIIKDLQFNTVHFKVVKNINFNYLSKYLVKRKEKSKYEIDGIIVTNNDLHIRNKSGNPDYAFAFKTILDNQKATSKIIDIEWKKSKDGYIKPTVIIEPVEIGGVTIKRVTANNAKFVVDNELGKGATIEIIRSGDVIPKIEKILQKAKTIDLPDGEWIWNDTGIDIICKDLNCDAVKIKNIYYFFSTLETKGLGEKIVEKLYNAGIDTIKKILIAKKKDFLSVEGFKEKSAENLFDSIKKSTINIPLHKLMKASNKLGHGMGSERVKSVLNKYPNILNIYKKWTKQKFINEIKTIDGWEEKTSTLFVENLPRFDKFFKSIENLITIEKNKKINEKGKYFNKTIVLSGFRDKDFSKYLEEEGAKIVNTVSKNTDILIIKDNTMMETSKVMKAKELNIEIKLKNSI